MSTWASSTTPIARAIADASTWPATDGVEGTRRRMEMAHRFVSGFGVATECGWGRGEPTRLPGLLESHRHAVDYLVTRR